MATGRCEMRRVSDRRVCYHHNTDRTSNRPGKPGKPGSVRAYKQAPGKYHPNACSRKVHGNVPHTGPRRVRG
eukprot:6112552-Prymnesium_polylepis.1